MKRWLNLVEYSSAYKVSLSTLRRRIRSGNIEYLKENGKYLVADNPIENNKTKKSYSKEDRDSSLYLKNEIVALKTLVKALEQKLVNKENQGNPENTLD